jgi:methylenetetrahydrofolate dehydrogenase (NADP+) / methenyltetrahydrofolate cyclohydrolase
MAPAQIIDGTAMAARLRAEVAAAAAQLKREEGVAPGLAVVLVGDDPASSVYVRNKAQQTAAVGMNSFVHRLAGTAPQTALIELICTLNRAADVHGILVQLPLPPHIDGLRVMEAIDPAKDVDALHPVHAGRLALGRPSRVPCTPAGVLMLAQSVRPDLKGLDAVVIGRSNIVGKSTAQLLLAQDCTVTLAHSRTRDLPAHVRRADLVIAAVGRPELVRGDWIKPGAIVIDVGINRIETAGGRTRLVGDVAFAEAVQVAGAITPVPGGVGPMTIACLLKNTVEAARARGIAQ